MWTSLTRHPDPSGDAAVTRIGVDVRRSPGGVLALEFRLEGKIESIYVPPFAAPRMGMRLWEHTCFEVFVGVDGDAAYHELNFAPSGEWAVYAFREYRRGGPLEEHGLSPDVAVRTADDRLELDASVLVERLSAAYPAAALRIGLSAVIESRDGARSYWALRHPPGAPDFHHPDAFALRLEPPRFEC